MSKQEKLYNQLKNKDYKSLTGNERVMLETLKKMFQAKRKFDNNNTKKETKIKTKENKNSSTITEEEYKKNLKACRKQAKKVSPNRIVKDIINKRNKALR